MEELLWSLGILGRDMRVLLVTMGLCEVLAWLWGRVLGGSFGGYGALCRA